MARMKLKGGSKHSSISGEIASLLIGFSTKGDKQALKAIKELSKSTKDTGKYATNTTKSVKAMWKEVAKGRIVSWGIRKVWNEIQQSVQKTIRIEQQALRSGASAARLYGEGIGLAPYGGNWQSAASTYANLADLRLGFNLGEGWDKIADVMKVLAKEGGVGKNILSKAFLSKNPMTMSEQDWMRLLAKIFPTLTGPTAAASKKRILGDLGIDLSYLKILNRGEDAYNEYEKRIEEYKAKYGPTEGEIEAAREWAKYTAEIDATFDSFRRTLMESAVKIIKDTDFGQELARIPINIVTSLRDAILDWAGIKPRTKEKPDNPTAGEEIVDKVATTSAMLSFLFPGSKLLRGISLFSNGGSAALKAGYADDTPFYEKYGKEAALAGLTFGGSLIPGPWYTKAAGIGVAYGGWKIGDWLGDKVIKWEDTFNTWQTVENKLESLRAQIEHNKKNGIYKTEEEYLQVLDKYEHLKRGGLLQMLADVFVSSPLSSHTWKTLQGTTPYQEYKEGIPIAEKEFRLFKDTVFDPELTLSYSQLAPYVDELVEGKGAMPLRDMISGSFGEVFSNWGGWDRNNNGAVTRDEVVEALKELVDIVNRISYNTENQVSQSSSIGGFLPYV